MLAIGPNTLEKRKEEKSAADLEMSDMASLKVMKQESPSNSTECCKRHLELPITRLG